MNTEVEVRVLNINKEELISKLEKNNAKFIGNWYQMRYVYDFKPIDPNRWIRLRTNGVDTTLTLKEVHDKTINGTKELEIKVSDIEITHLILEKLGYKRRSIQENKRIRYILNNVEIDIDTWPNLNPYVEFEGDSEEKIKEVFLILGLDYKYAITDNAQDIYMSLGYTQEDLNNLRFEGEEICKKNIQ